MAASDHVAHPAIEPIAWLVGTWRGEGEGSYPTIATFRYGEEIVFDHVGKPFVSYRQRTWSLPDGAPLHSESGYLRPQGDGRLEYVIAQPTGIVEVGAGTVEHRRVAVAASTEATRTPTAVLVGGVERAMQVEGDELTYELRMATDRVPMTLHLRATLRRVVGP